jgi:hypothetical protein
MAAYVQLVTRIKDLGTDIHAEALQAAYNLRPGLAATPEARRQSIADS